MVRKAVIIGGVVTVCCVSSMYIRNIRAIVVYFVNCLEAIDCYELMILVQLDTILHNWDNVDNVPICG